MEEKKNLNTLLGYVDPNINVKEFEENDLSWKSLMVNRMRNLILLDFTFTAPALKHCLSRSVNIGNDSLQKSEIDNFKSCMETYTSLLKFNQ
jgi:hypothetical protein